MDKRIITITKVNNEFDNTEEYFIIMVKYYEVDVDKYTNEHETLIDKLIINQPFFNADEAEFYTKRLSKVTGISWEWC